MPDILATGINTGIAVAKGVLVDKVVDAVPPTYQRVGWLGCSGFQYIVVDNDITFDNPFFDFSFEMSVIQRWYPYLCAHSQGNLSLATRSENGGFFVIKSEETFLTGNVWNPYTLYRIKRVINDPTGIYVNNVRYSATIGENASVAGSFVLFTFADLSTQYGLIGRFYGGQIYDGATLRYSFIPVYRKSDTKPGLYDTVSNTFFTNGSTWSDFTIGNEVS